MKLSRTQRKAEMERAAAEMIETLLDWEEENQTPNLREWAGMRCSAAPHRPLPYWLSK